MEFFKTICPYTQPEVFNLGLRSIKMHWTSSLARTLALLKYHRTTVASFGEQGDKQIPSIMFQATRRAVVQYSTRDYSEFTRVYCNDTSCVTGKWWPNSILTLNLLTWRIWWAPNNASRWQMGFNLAFKGLIKKCVSFTAVSVIFVHPLYMLPSYIPWGD